MLTKEGLSLFLDRLGRQAADVRELQTQNVELAGHNTDLHLTARDATASRDALQQRVTQLETDNRCLEIERDQARTSAAEASRKLDGARTDVFPHLLRRGMHVYVAFADTANGVGGVKDDTGAYTFAGAHRDMQTFLNTPLNPRCYATFPALNLLRLPNEPMGRLVVDDDLPF